MLAEVEAIEPIAGTGIEPPGRVRVNGRELESELSGFQTDTGTVPVEDSRKASTVAVIWLPLT